MNRIIATTLVAFTAFAGAAQAMTSASDIEAGVRSVAPSVDVSALTESQRLQVLSVLLGGESDSEKRTVIRAIAN